MYFVETQQYRLELIYADNPRTAIRRYIERIGIWYLERSGGELLVRILGGKTYAVKHVEADQALDLTELEEVSKESVIFVESDYVCEECGGLGYTDNHVMGKTHCGVCCEGDDDGNT
jgi:hypothetical protein